MTSARPTPPPTGIPRRTLDTRARIALPLCGALLLGLAIHRLIIAEPAARPYSEFIGMTMNGRITADRMQSNLRLTTMNGAVDVEMGSADWSGKLRIKSMNGAITVALPASANVSVEAETMNGRVSSDWDDVQVHGRRKNHGSGPIGSGGRDLTLSTMNGSIRLRRTR